MEQLLFRRWLLICVIGLFSAGALTANAAITASPSPAASSTTISWDPSGSGTVHSYRVDAVVNETVIASSGTLSADARSYKFTSLSPGSYRFEVYETVTTTVMIGGELYPSQSTNGIGWLSVTVKGSPGVPGTPTFSNLSHASSGKDSDGNFTVSWTAGANTPERYELYEKNDSGSWVRVYNGSNRSVARSLGDGTYYYKVRSCSADECSAFTTTSSVVVIKTPGVPGSISGPSSSTTGSYSLSWTASTGIVSSYQLQQQKDGGSFSTIQSSLGLSKSISGVSDGTYGYRVRACNSLSCSGWTSTKSVLVLKTPSVPGNFTLPSTDTDGSYVVSWSASSGSVEKYQLQRRLAGTSSWNLVQSSLKLSAPESGMGDGTYEYRVRACNALSCSGWTSTKSIQVLNTPSVPGPISGPSSNTTGSYSLDWTASTGSVSSYQLQQQKDGGSFSTIQSSLALSISISGVSDGSYGYRVRACNSLSCSGWTSTKSVSVLKTPSVPGNFTLPSTDTDGSYALSWSASDGSVDSYELQRRLAGTSSWNLVQNSLNLSASESGMADGTYEYRLRACNALSCSAWTSNKSIQVIKTPGTPGNIDVPPESFSGAFEVTWEASSGTVDNYQVEEQQDGGPFALASTTTSTNLGMYKTVEAQYGYRVRACNLLSCSSWSPTATTTVSFDGLVSWSKKGATDPILDQPLAGQVGNHDPTVGQLKGKAGVSGGAASYTVPIVIPPGRNQIEPDVALQYSSRAGNAIAGMGWSLSSASSIRRCSATQAQDGFAKSITFGSDDRLCLDGQRLQLLSGTYGASGAVYATELDSFARVTQSGSLASTASFTVKTKNGRTRYYGTTSDSRVVPGGLSVGYEWYVKQEEDPSGNSIIYTYTGYGPGEVLITNIQYTGRGSVPGSREVKFEYQARPDKTTTYIAEGLLSRSQRLSAVKTFVDYDPVREYGLSYGTSLTSGRSLLESVSECAVKGGVKQCYPATTFAWYEPAVSHAAPAPLEQSDHLGAAGTFRSTDVNGDGRNELLITIPEDYPLSGPFRTEIHYLDENLNRDTSITPNPVDFASLYGDSARPQMADINLDGKPDATDFSDDGQLTYYHYDNSGSTASTIAISHPATPIVHLNTEFADINNDGYTDFLMVEKFGDDYRVVGFTHNRSGASPGFTSIGVVADLIEIVHADGSRGRHLETFSLQDINGDGLKDIFFTYSNPNEKQSSHRIVYGRYSSGSFSFGASVPGSNLGLPSNTFYNQSTLVDVNGDSLPDFISAEDTGWMVRLNTGTSFSAAKAIGTSHGMHGWQMAAYARYQAVFGGLVPADIDQDGDQEILVATHTNDSFCYSRVTGGTTEETVCNDTLQGGTDENGYYTSHGESLKEYDGRRFYWSIIDIDVATSSSGVSSITNQIRHNVVLAGLPGNNHGGGLKVLDLNGDGAPELFNRIRKNFCLDNTNGGYCGTTPTDNFETFSLQQDPATELPPGYYVFANTTGVADHMHEATTAFGKKSSWQYAPIAQSGGRSAGETRLYQVPLDTSDRYIPSDPGSEYFYFGSSMHVVEAFSESNGLGSSLNTTSYAYREAVYNRQGRGFQGFRTIIAEDQANATRSVTDFHQIFPLAGKPEQSRTCLLTDDERCATSPISKTSYQYTTRTLTGTDVSWSYPHSTVTTKYDLGSRSYLSSVSRNIDSVDQYGNVLEERTTTDTGFGTVATATSRQYSYDASNWWIDRLVSETVTTNPVSNRTHPIAGGALIYPGAGTDVQKVVQTEFLLWNETQRLPTQVKTSALQGGGKWVQKDYVYNTDGLVTSETTRSEGESQIRQVRRSYTADGYFPEAVTRENGNFDLITQQTVDPRHGGPTAQIDPNGLITTIDYDAFGRSTMIHEPGVPAKYISLQWCSTCNEPDAVFTRTQVQDGAPATVAYLDLLGRERRIETQGFEGSGPVVVTKQFNARGLPSFESVPSYTGSSLGTHFDSYDELGRLLDKRVDQTARQTLSINYHHDGYRTTVTAGGLVMSRAYNGIGQLMQTTDAIGGVTQYLYDGAGNPIVVQDANGNQITASYNALAQKSWVDDPNMGSKQFGYNGFGEPLSETDANNNTTHYVHDLQGRVIERIVNGVSEASFEFDTAANGLGLLAVERRND
jgi:YD repeat-containing protein